MHLTHPLYQDALITTDDSGSPLSFPLCQWKFAAYHHVKKHLKKYSRIDFVQPDICQIEPDKVGDIEGKHILENNNLILTGPATQTSYRLNCSSANYTDRIYVIANDSFNIREENDTVLIQAGQPAELFFQLCEDNRNNESSPPQRSCYREYAPPLDCHIQPLKLNTSRDQLSCVLRDLITESAVTVTSKLNFENRVATSRLPACLFQIHCQQALLGLDNLSLHFLTSKRSLNFKPLCMLPKAVDLAEVKAGHRGYPTCQLRYHTICKVPINKKDRNGAFLEAIRVDGSELLVEDLLTLSPLIEKLSEQLNCTSASTSLLFQPGRVFISESQR
ncbi:unnamed protein product [Protopolystoma xenopodis]|uniref:Uncharacterized protein n=1 Tax=Protopolystoma xenopodis TaxID=117903 RepID=A0A3S5B0Y9_9PLAT|nr:unnamed protein product [Protopolystoma xenopodis]